MRDDASLREDVTSTEETPLIRSGASSPSPLSDRSSTSSEIYRDTGHDLDVPNQKVGQGRAAAILLNFYMLIFLQASNMSGMTMAQSVITAELDAYEKTSWFTSSFLIALSSCAPLAGRLASIFSPRSIVLASSLLFAIGSLVTSQAHAFWVFIVGRVIAGVRVVLAVILVLELTTKRRRGLFIGLVNAGVTSGVSLGAVVFGALISSTGWRALFYAQVPISAVAGLGVYLSIPKSFTSGQNSDEGSLSKKLKNIDYLGAIFLTGAIVFFLYGLSETITATPLLLSLATLAIFVLVEYKVAADPIIPPAILENRGTLLSCVAQLGLMAAQWAVLFYTPMAALAVRGFAPAAAGGILVPTNLGFGVGGVLVGHLHVRRAGSFWAACLASVALFGASLLALALALSADPPSPFALPLLVVFCNGFAGSFGSAVGGGVFTRTLRARLEEGFRALDGIGDGELLSPDRRRLVRAGSG
ncbi:hypothetical protein DL762_000999 [Monosporascus cannonballus]|uniref:Major facilitator superfamily (MFS) profile domain-containing protein n=1 Tax=Monosporascus cannonballus TaxID=155416 RepID=A0ABY0HI17_9PEZI|nr:hypothetical protein DL762_000999 [Monosporascus cannonballus]